MRTLALYFVLFVALAAAKKITYLQDDPVPQTLEWFEEQKLNHFDPIDRRVWKQRYWVVDQFFQPDEQGAVLLLICGEYTCPGVRESRLFPVQLAQTHKALILVLEHRYYGESMPFGADSLKTENLRYLGVRQALDDLAYFINWIRRNQKYGVQESTPWISIGGSYPGAMAAWMQYQYPHLLVGSLASSAVVNIIVDFPKFDKQIQLSALKQNDQEACKKDIEALVAYADANLTPAFKTKFHGAQQLTDDEFLFMFADSIVLKIQYGARSELCNGLKGKATIDEKIDFLIALTKDEVSPQDYGSVYLKDATYDPVNLKSARQWMYQCCTEVGWWQTVSDTPMRSKKLNINFYKQFCSDIFGNTAAGVPLWPDEDRANAFFGGLKLDSDSLIMTNGDEDPWKWASVIQNQGKLIVRVTDCPDAGHCVELYTPDDAKDCDQLKTIRTEISNKFGEWITNHYAKLQKSVDM